MPFQPLPKGYHINSEGIYHPGTKKLYYVGGSYTNVSTGPLYNTSMSYATTFDTTTNNQWTSESINGPPPPQRFGHTVTLRMC